VRPRRSFQAAFLALLLGSNVPAEAGANSTPEPQWWSLKPIVRSEVPRVEDSRFRVQNPIDAFIVTKLAEKGLPQSPEADARTLIRRLYFDVIGLPPTPEEVEAFVKECGVRNSE
jgi:hypothetical protein